MCAATLKYALNGKRPISRHELSEVLGLNMLSYSPNPWGIFYYRILKEKLLQPSLAGLLEWDS